MGRKFLFACTGMIAASLSLAGCCTSCKDGCCLGGMCDKKPVQAAGAGKGAGPVTTTAATPNAKTNPAAWNQNGKTATATAAAPVATPTQPTGWNGTPAAGKPLTGLPESIGRAPYTPTTPSQPAAITPVSGTGYVPGAASPIATSIEKPLPPASYTPPPHVHSTAAPAPVVPTAVPSTQVVPAAAPAPVMPSSALPTTSAAPVGPSTGGQIYSVPASSAMPVVETSSAKPTTAPAPQDHSPRPASAASESKFSSAGTNDVVVMPSSGGPSISGPAVTPGQND